MRSRLVRLAIGSIALIAFAGSAFLLVSSEKQIADSRARMRTFDLHAREARDVLADLRSAQQAYVAAGQGRDFWMPKVESSRETAVSKAAALRTEAGSTDAKVALDQAAGAIAEFSTIDTRVRDYLTAGQDLMAADVVFTEGSATVAAAASGVEAARVAEQDALDASEAGIRQQEMYGLAGAGVVGLLVVLLLAVTGTGAPAVEPVGLSDTSLNLARHGGRARAIPACCPGSVRAESALLKAAAELCTDFGRVRDIEDLNGLLSRAATAMDASGLVVWLGSTSGADLRPVLAHGYSAATIARMPSVPRAANNAAAAAYRTSGLQIVLSKPGAAAGAIVAPLVSVEGCIGALSIEIKRRRRNLGRHPGDGRNFRRPAGRGPRRVSGGDRRKQRRRRQSRRAGLDRPR